MQRAPQATPRPFRAPTPSPAWAGVRRAAAAASAGGDVATDVAHEIPARLRGLDLSRTPAFAARLVADGPAPVRWEIVSPRYDRPTPEALRHLRESGYGDDVAPLVVALQARENSLLDVAGGLGLKGAEPAELAHIQRVLGALQATCERYPATAARELHGGRGDDA